MRKKIILLSLLAIVSHQSSAGDIFELLQLARRENSGLKISTITLEKAELTLNRSRNSFLPELSANYTYLEQPRLDSEIARSIFPPNQETAKLTGRLNLFNGGSDKAKYESSKILLEGSKHSREYNEESLDLLVTNLALKAKAITNEIEILNKQLDELSNLDRQLSSARKSGRIRASSILSLKSKISVLKSEIIFFQKNLSEVVSSLGELTGKNTAEITQFINSIRLDIPSSATILTESTIESSEARAKEASLLASQFERKSITGQFMPSVNLESNYYAVRPRGLARDLNWDIALKIDIPLFSKLETVSSLKEVTLKERQASIELDRIRRERKLRWEYLRAAREFSKKRQIELTQALSDSLEYYSTLKTEFTNGLATDVELIDATTNLFQTKRSLNTNLLEETELVFEMVIRSHRSIEEIKNLMRPLER